jgi:hypothetical protein
MAKGLRSGQLLLSLGFAWVIAVSVFVAIDSRATARPPIAAEGLLSLVNVYLPVLALSVFLLLFLTRRRDPFTWTERFCVDSQTAGKEVLWIFAYLLTSQLILGYALKTGLHFPGPNVYQQTDHRQGEVITWMLLNGLFYVALPICWLNRVGFRLKNLLSPWPWRRNLWIIAAYWALDFFGPIMGGVDFFSLSTAEYAVGVPASVVANTVGAGLPVLLLMHVMLIPRLMLLFDSKLAVIAIAGFFYAIFSLFDPGVDYGSVEMGALSITYIIMTQVLVGMGKATFTVVTGNPWIHFITLHVLSARIPFDTEMYAEIFAG